MSPLTPQEVFNGISMPRRSLGIDNVKWVKSRALSNFQRLQEKIGRLIPSGSGNRRHAKLPSEKCRRSTTSSSGDREPPSPEADNRSILRQIFRMGGSSSNCNTSRVTATASPTPIAKGRSVRRRPSPPGLMLMKCKPILGPGPRTACLDLSKPETSTTNSSRPDTSTRHNAVYIHNTSASSVSQDTTDAIDLAHGPSVGRQQPSAYDQARCEDNYLEISDHEFAPPTVPCCGLQARLDGSRTGSHRGLSTCTPIATGFNSSLLKPRESGLRSSTAVQSSLMINPRGDYPHVHSAADEQSERSDTETLVNPTPPYLLDSGTSLGSQQGGIRNPCPSGCVSGSLLNQPPNTSPTGNPSDRELPLQLVPCTHVTVNQWTAIKPHSGPGGYSPTEQTSTEPQKLNINDVPSHRHTIGCGKIISRGLSFLSTCLSWISPLFPC